MNKNTRVRAAISGIASPNDPTTLKLFRSDVFGLLMLAIVQAFISNSDATHAWVQDQVRDIAPHLVDAQFHTLLAMIGDCLPTEPQTARNETWRSLAAELVHARGAQ